MNEADFAKRVCDYARTYGWYIAHFRTVRVQRRNGSTYYETPAAEDGKGFPDLVLVRERIIYAELKLDRGSKIYPEQVEWARRIVLAGGEHYWWKPRDWDAIVATLRRR